MLPTKKMPKVSQQRKSLNQTTINYHIKSEATYKLQVTFTNSKGIFMFRNETSNKILDFQIFQDLNLLAILQSDSKISIWDLIDGQFMFAINDEKTCAKTPENLMA